MSRKSGDRLPRRGYRTQSFSCSLGTPEPSPTLPILESRLTSIVAEFFIRYGFIISHDRVFRCLNVLLRKIDGFSIDKVIGHSTGWNINTQGFVGVHHFLPRSLSWVFIHKYTDLF